MLAETGPATADVPSLSLLLVDEWDESSSSLSSICCRCSCDAMMMDGEVVFAVVVLCEQCFVLLCLEATASWVLAGKARRRHGLSLYS
jgi:hypothetical protein